MDQPRVDIIKNVLYSDSLYFLHFRKNFCILILQKILISFMTIFLLLFIFFIRKISTLVMMILVLFVFFSSERLWYLSQTFFESFSLFFFDNSYLSFLYIENKLKRKKSSIFFICFKKLTLSYEYFFYSCSMLVFLH